MLEWLKSAWASWKVRVTVVGGVLVVATAYGTCSYDPQATSEATVVPVETVASPVTTPVSETATGENEGAENTTTTTDVTTGEICP
jgi:hypothetical protein